MMLTCPSTRVLLCLLVANRHPVLAVGQMIVPGSEPLMTPHHTIVAVHSLNLVHCGIPLEANGCDCAFLLESQLIVDRCSSPGFRLCLVHG